MRTASRGFELQMAGYGLTTARIFYGMPDYPEILQEYVWQEYDVAPEFPVLQRFLVFWKRELAGPLHSVQVAHKRLISVNDWKRVDGVLLLN